MAAKKPTGEFPKRNSSLAKFIKSSDSGKSFTQAEARTAAGKYRDMEKAAGPKGFSGMGALDRSGVALGKAEAAVKAMRKPAAKKATSPAARGAKPLLPVKPARPARPAATTRQVGKAKPLMPKKKAR